MNGLNSFKGKPADHSSNKEIYVFCLILGLIPFFELTKLGESVTIPSILGFLLVYTFMLRFFKREAKIKWRNEYLLGLVLFAIIFIAAVGGVDFSNSVYFIKLYMECLLLAFFSANFFTRPKDIKIAIWVLMFSIVAVLVLFFFEIYGGYNLGFTEIHETKGFYSVNKVNVERYGGSRGDPNFWAAQLNIALSFVIGFFFLYRLLIIRIVLVLFGLLIIWGLFGTYSISGILGAAFISLASLFYFTKDLKRNKKIAAIIIIIVVLSSLLYFLPEDYKSRILVKLVYQDEEVTTGRIYAWGGGLKLLAASPLLGVGPGNSVWEIPKYVSGLAFRNFQAAHNTFISMAVEAGVFALAIFVFLVFSILSGLSKSIKSAKERGKLEDVILGRTLFICLVAFLLQGLVLDLQSDKYLYILFGLGLAYKDSIRV